MPIRKSVLSKQYRDRHYKSVYDLDRDQLQELKVNYLQETENRDLSYGEILDIDEIVSDEEIFGEYDGYEFTDDDFFCSSVQASKRIRGGRILSNKRNSANRKMSVLSRRFKKDLENKEKTPFNASDMESILSSVTKKDETPARKTRPVAPRRKPVVSSKFSDFMKRKQIRKSILSKRLEDNHGKVLFHKPLLSAKKEKFEYKLSADDFSKLLNGVKEVEDIKITKLRNGVKLACTNKEKPLDGEGMWKKFKKENKEISKYFDPEISEKSVKFCYPTNLKEKLKKAVTSSFRINIENVEDAKRINTKFRNGFYN